MKKYLFSALALSLLFACSSDDLIEKKVASNDQFPGIEKVDATFSVDEGAVTRMAKDWEIELGDQFGLAWLGTAAAGQEVEGPKVVIDGNAYQNHPLNVVREGNRTWFQPQTSIYVGKYFLYLPYDKETVAIGPIQFNSLKNQTLVKGQGGKGWSSLAKNAIVIADKWTHVSTTGENIDGDGKMWNKAGIDNPYKIYPAGFSNMTGLDMQYANNNPTFGAKTEISGATDIKYEIPAGSSVGAATIKGGTITVEGAANSFTYAPTTEPVVVANVTDLKHSGTFWADKSGKASDAVNYYQVGEDNGFHFTQGAITLNVDEPISTGDNNSKEWFWINSLPASNGVPTANSAVITTLTTSYGTVTINNTLCDTGNEPAQKTGCAYAFGRKNGDVQVWHKLIDGAADSDEADPDARKWGLTNPAHNTFVKNYGYQMGKFVLNVDFATANMSEMHITNDGELQNALKFYIASGKNTGAILKLDGKSETDKTFELSKISIALLQTINRSATVNLEAQPAVDTRVLVQACDEHNAPVKIIVTQEGQSGDLATKIEVPTLDNVFATETAVYLSKDYTWTWNGEIKNTVGDDVVAGQLKIDEMVTSITNEGTLNVTNTNVQLSEEDVPLYNANGATMNIKAKTAVKNPLTNLGVINVEAKKELRAFGVDIINDAEDKLMPTDIITNDPAVPADKKVGLINNYGVVGVSANTDGKFYNYGKIIMKTADAITLLTSNEKSSVAEASAFGQPFNKQTNKMGTVVLPEGEPEAIVSVSNTAENGFIMYKWNAATYSHATGNIKYNTIIVDKDIEFTGEERSTEIQFILFNGEKTKVVNPGVPVAASRLSKLKGIIVNDGKSVIIEKTNRLNCLVGAYLGEDATVYRGGVFDVPATAVNNYFGDWVMEEQVVEW